MINLGELKGISKLPIRFSASADDWNTFSFVCVSCACGACTRKCFALAFMSGLCVNLNCSRICDAFNQKAINISSVFHVFMFNILYFESNFFFLIDCLDCPSKLYCYTDFLVKYWDKLIFLQMSAGDLMEASFQWTEFQF